MKNIRAADVTNDWDNSFFEVLSKSQRPENCREYHCGDMDDNGSDQMNVIIFV